jgi:hypothetical protein
MCNFATATMRFLENLNDVKTTGGSSRAFQHCRDMDASLSERLDSLAQAVRKLSPPFADAVDRLVTRLQQSGAGETAPQVGQPLPPFICLMRLDTSSALTNC